MARKFGAVSTDAVLGTITAITGDWTWAAWYRPITTPTNFKVLFTIETAGAVAVQSIQMITANGELSAVQTYSTTNAQVTSPPVVLGQWNLVVVTHTLATKALAFYLGTLTTPMTNVGLAGATAGVGTPTAAAVNYRVGNNAATSAIEGDIENNYLDTRVWSQAEMEVMRRGGVVTDSPVTSSRAVWWPLTDSAAASAIDNGPNGVTGTYTGTKYAAGPVFRVAATQSGIFAPLPNPLGLPFIGPSIFTTAAPPVAYTQVTTDPEGLLDSMTQVLTAAQVVSDPQGLLDAATHVGAFAPQLDNPLGITDLETGVQATVRAPADPLGLLDAESQTAAFVRSLPGDPLGLLDAATHAAVFAQSPADPLGLLDAATRVAAFLQSISDPLGLLDLMSQVFTPGAVNYTQTVPDVLGLLDLMAQAAAFARSPADPLGLTDAATRVAAASRTLSDVASVVDINIASDSFNRPDSSGFPDSMGYTDAAYGGRSLLWWTFGINWEIAGNRAKQSTGGAGQFVAVVDTGFADGVVECTFPAFSDGGVSWRVVDNSNYWIINGDHIYHYAAGIFVPLGPNFADALGRSVIAGDRVRVAFSGDTHKVYVQPGASGAYVLVSTVTDASLNTATQHGLRSNCAVAGDDTFEDFTFYVPLAQVLTAPRTVSDAMQLRDNVADPEVLPITGPFSNGRWVRTALNVKAGNVVTTTCALTGGINPVVAGVFLGASGVAPYGVSADGASPQGAWVGTYGGDGYALAAVNAGPTDLVNMPLCTFATTGTGFQWSEVAGAPEARCLTDASGTPRWDGVTQHEGTWYDAAGSFTITLTFTSDYVGDLSIYCLDFDTVDRRETITVEGNSTTAVRQVASYVRAVSDALGLTDLLAQLGGVDRTVSDPEGLLDLLTQLVFTAYAQTNSDPEGLLDAMTSAAVAPRTVSDALGLLDLMAQVSVAAQTVGDALGITDLEAQVLAALRSIDDRVGLLDLMTQLVTAAQTVSDPEGLVDASAQASVAAQTMSDVLGLLDLMAQVASYAQTVSDPQGLLDLMSQARALSVTMTDLEGLLDVASQLSAAAQAVSDALGLLDALAQASVALRTVDDPEGLLDTTAQLLAAAQTVADALGLLDLMTQVVIAARTVSDPEGLLDLMAQVLSASQTLSDPLGLLDAMTRVLAAAQTPTEALGLLDLLTQAVAAARAISDPEGLLDAMTQARDLSVTVTDPLGVLDVALQLVIAARSIDDPEGLLDALAQASVALRAISDPEGLLDLMSQQVTSGFNQIASDALGLLDAALQALDAAHTFTDPEGLTDSAVAAGAWVRLLAETVGLTDAASQLAAFAQTVDDPEGALDTAAQLGAFARTVLDAVDLLDTETSVVIGSQTFTDRQGLTDLALSVLIAARLIDDPGDLTDATQSALVLPVTVEDPLGATDAAVRLLAAARALDDAAGLLDALVAASTQTVTFADPLGLLDDVTVVGALLKRLGRIVLDNAPRSHIAPTVAEFERIVDELALRSRVDDTVDGPAVETETGTVGEAQTDLFP